METEGEVLDAPTRPLPVVGGQLALDFADTVDGPGGPAYFDHLGTASALVSWSLLVDIVTPQQARRLELAARSQPQAADAALARVHDLRQTVVEVFTDIASGSAPRTTHWTALRPWVTEAVSASEYRGADHPQLVWPESDQLDALLHPIAYAALQLLTGPDLGRLKRCAGCPWLFLDQSKNRSRRWCTMDICGRDHKMALYVARRAERRRAASAPS